jgi:hypothetical protein
LTALWGEISRGESVTLKPNIDLVEYGNGRFNEAMRQLAVDGTVVRNLDELYESAAIANEEFERILKTMITMIESDADEPIELMIAPLKGKYRAQEKVIMMMILQLHYLNIHLLLVIWNFFTVMKNVCKTYLLTFMKIIRHICWIILIIMGLFYILC